MAHYISRRSWLRSSALLAGGLGFFSGLPPGFTASPRQQQRFLCRITDATLGRMAHPSLKARLFANENPFGPSALAKQAMLDAMDSCYQYPHFFAGELQEQIARREGLRREHVLLGAGSSTLLHAAAMYYGRRGGSILTADPSYDDLPEIAHFFGATIVRVPLTQHYQLDLKAMEKQITPDTRLVYICNPNNPTGTSLPPAELKAFCERVSPRVPVFVDEAYIDYLPNGAEASLTSAVRSSQNVMVSRTFSKLHGFAGLRVGYLLAPPPLVQALDAYTTGVFCMSALSIRAAMASLGDEEFLQEALQKTADSKNFLLEVLQHEGYQPIPSTTNFVLFPIYMEGKRFAEEMWKRGVGIRHWHFNKQHWCRVSLGRMDEMEAFARALKELS
jgi:histidinol-phosphate aminotransferase